MGHLGLILALLVAGTAALDFQACLRKDSISCLQVELFRDMRSFFDQESIDIGAGLTLVKEAGKEKTGRSLEEGVLTAGDVEAREDALEEYALTRVGRLLEERRFSWNLAPLADKAASAARALAASIPQQLKDQFASFMSEEGRGKKKKILRALLPLLLGLKVKLGAFMVLAYFVIALIAKKALVVSLISLAIAGFIAIRKLLSQQGHHHGHHEVHEVGHHGGGGWAGPAYGGGYSSSGGWDSYDTHGAYSNNVAHSLAYGGQKPARR